MKLIKKLVLLLFLFFSIGFLSFIYLISNKTYPTLPEGKFYDDNNNATLTIQLIDEEYFLKQNGIGTY